MKTINFFTLLYRKYPLFRTGTTLVAILLILGIVTLVTYKAKKIPAITSVNPPVGSPGDLMIISGVNFGDNRGVSDYVEVGGSRITASGYLKWSDTQIKIILPSNVQDGLVVVCTKSGNSKPGFFANEAGIPVEVPPDTKTSMPVITSISPETASPGSLLVLNGINFGTIRNNGMILFTAAREEQQQLSQDDNSFLSASEDNYDYEYWSDSEIHVRVPDGAATGHIYVKTEKGNSNYSTLEVKSPAGKKTYSAKKTFLIQLTADIDDINSKSNTTLSLRVPRPQVFAQQPVVDLTECTPEPVFEHYQNTIIHHLDLAKITAKKLRFNHSFVVEEYSIQTEINPKAVRPFTDKNRVLYTTYTSPDEIIHSDDEKYTSLAKKIVKRETNPYNQAKIIYEYILNNFDLIENQKKNNTSPDQMLDSGKGDAYDFAIVYATLLRSCKIPAVPMCGILVDADLKAQNHWWCEFYLENFGWVPADPALSAGLPYKSFRPVEDPVSFYFGNIDSQHITFSRGFNQVKPSLANSNIVYRERTYALQSIWEESSSGTVNYSSLWNQPVIAGIY